MREQVEALTAGGVVLYLRHPATARGGVDSPDWPREQQRLLSAEGEQQARDLGAAFRAHGWTVHEVLSSPSYRCRDAADLAFGSHKVEPLLTGLLSESGEGEDELREHSTSWSARPCQLGACWLPSGTRRISGRPPVRTWARATV